MNSYEREVIGDIVIVRGIVFENTTSGKKEPDHAWKDGRPCMIIYSDNELDYLLALTSVDKDGSKQHFKINDENILYEEDFKYRYNRKDRINKSIKGYVNLESIYKMPISGHDKIGKVTFETYKNIFKAMKMRRPNQTIREILNNAVSVRR